MKKYAIHHKPEKVWGQTLRGRVTVTTVYDDREVCVMAEAEGYAMVRRKGAYPYVCPVKELEAK
jgi:hypothetical protein